MVEEASRMGGKPIHKALNYQIRQQLVSPLLVELEPDNYEVHFRTDLAYQMRVTEDPNNYLLLENYVQFLHLLSRTITRQKSATNMLLKLNLKTRRH
ncbi:hypothetical protein PVK06_021396 [Gossypium arboreum]|uniref:Uncharacterized protein n=1 Tax=Gossypium arboreum TaxID=29729 RepID=A0ABR0PPV9_GOSAR|nr:hypothetical protein PVK06_021396 [Gossypium arboreum]